jgi:chlorobactene glucosyltransferase
MGIFTFNLVRPRDLRPQFGSLPKVSVVVPARNEETNIGRCLESLLEQDYENYEIVAIDDRSTDATAQIMQALSQSDSRLKVIHSESQPPEGWTGKCYALTQAAAVADGEWLYFADADTFHYPSAISLAVSCAVSKRAHMVSFWPLHEVHTFWEKLITPLLWGTFFWCDAFQSVNDLSYDTAYAVGHCILINRRAYDFVGGHGAVREWIIEDHALAKLIKGRGFHLIMADGRKLLQVRMYTELRTLWHGWSKMLYACVGYDDRLLLAVVVMLFTTFITPFCSLFWILWLQFTGNVQHEPILMSYLVAAEVISVFLWWVAALSHCRGGRFWHFFLLPLGACVLAACYVRSAHLVNSGSQVNWKGRTYTVSKLKVPGIN